MQATRVVKPSCGILLGCEMTSSFFHQPILVCHITPVFFKWTVANSFLLLLLVKNAILLPPVIKIGAVFTTSQKGGSTESAFKYAVHSINKDKILLPKSKLIYDITYIPKDDSFHAFKNACQQVRFGVQAVFGPSDPVIGSHVHSICDALDIPHLESRLDLDSRSKEFSINLHPSRLLLNRAFLDVVRFLNWTKMAVVYEDSHGLVKLRELIRSPYKDLEIYLRQMGPDNYGMVLQELKQKEIHNFLVDTKPENLPFFLRNILQLQMNDYKYHYLLTTFDIESFDLEEFGHNFINMTGFRLVDVEDMGVRKILKEMESFRLSDKFTVDKSSVIKAESALMYDSVLVFATGLQTLEQSHTLRVSNISCEAEVPWDGGLSLINYINSVETKGLSGPIEFKEGRRVRFKLDLLKLKPHSLAKVGEWSPGSGVNITDPTAFSEPVNMNVTLVVTTILEKPYVMLKSRTNDSQEEYLEGFCIDLLKAISDMVGFEYRLSLVPDGKYGVYDYKTGEWNGIVKELIDKKADLAVGSMTINYARESVIDFTKPFMNLGISILFKAPESQPARLFSFMNPLALDIWLYIFGAYASVSLTILMVARLSPYEWQKPHPCDTGNDTVANQFSLGNCFWFTIGTLMQQGSDLNPKATSTRIVGATWWFFTLIIISSYTANLAAFLTVERMISPIENAEDLAGQTEIAYGTLDSGSTMTFFRDSMIETYKKMWRFMDNRKPSVFVSTYEEGVARVLKGNYAFLMESTMLDYVVQRDCNLMRIGGLLDNKGYGIATPMGSPWRDKISLAILELQEKGEIQMLYDKWWKSSRDSCHRGGKEKDSKANALGVDTIGGVFIVLLGGLAIAVLVSIFEFCYHSKSRNDIESKNAPVPHQSLFAEMAAELCFALRCRGSRQRPAFKRQCSKCVSDTSNVFQKPELLPSTEETSHKDRTEFRRSLYDSDIDMYLPDGSPIYEDT